MATPSFWMHDDPNITMDGWSRVCDSEWRADVELLRLLRAHPSRVAQPELATLFIVTTPLYQSFACDGSGSRTQAARHRERADAAMHALTTSPWFLRRGGHDHLMPGHHWRFSQWAYEDPKTERLLRREWWALLANVTQTRYEYYPFGNDTETVSRYPKSMGPMTNWQMTRRSVVVPYSTPPELQLAQLEPPDYSWPSWRARNVTVFYQTRRGNPPLAHGSAPLRHCAPTHPENWGSHALIGFGLPRAAWLRGWNASRFCLVTRGDTPTSHSLYNALAGACIPVVVSDDIDAVGTPPFGIAPIERFAVRIHEADFLRAPQAVLPRLLALPDATLRGYLAAMADAQRALLMAHPSSEVASHALRHMAAQLRPLGLAHRVGGHCGGRDSREGHCGGRQWEWKDRL